MSERTLDLGKARTVTEETPSGTTGDPVPVAVAVGTPESSQESTSSLTIDSGPRTVSEMAIEFAVHTVTGTLVFVVIALVALGLEVGVSYVRQTHEVSELIVVGLCLGANLLFLSDMLLFGVYIWVTFGIAFNEIRALARARKPE